MADICFKITIFIIRILKSLELFFWKVVGAEKIATKLLKDDGVVVNGNQPWDIIVNDKSFYPRFMSGGPKAMGEMYTEGIVNCQDVATMVHKLLCGKILKIYFNPWSRLFNYLEFIHFNLQTKTRAWIVGKKHYDLGNDLFQAMLDPTMNYTCAYWQNATNLTEAQTNKMDLAARKLNLSEGMTVLDVGCGWGGFAKYIATKYKVKVVGITISEEQAVLAREMCKGLDVEIRLQDYRDVTETFDRIASIGVFEHIGWRNYPVFFKTMRKCLKDDGLFLIHTIAVNKSYWPRAEPWMMTYVFPNAMVPYPFDIIRETDKHGWFIEDWQNFGWSYSKTLVAWKANFEEKWPTLEEKYGKEFYRMWTYYLTYAQGMFTTRTISLWQIVYPRMGFRESIMLGDEKHYIYVSKNYVTRL